MTVYVNNHQIQDSAPQAVQETQMSHHHVSHSLVMTAVVFVFAAVAWTHHALHSNSMTHWTVTIVGCCQVVVMTPSFHLKSTQCSSYMVSNLSSVKYWIVRKTMYPNFIAFSSNFLTAFKQTNCSYCLDFDTTLPLSPKSFVPVPGYVSSKHTPFHKAISIWVHFSSKTFLQNGHGALLNASSHGFWVDSSDMTPCMLAPSQCATGATYIFWIKLLDENRGPVLTTMDWNVKREGVRIIVAGSGRLSISVFKFGTGLNSFEAASPGILHNNINMWQHIAVVFHATPRVEFYIDGVSRTRSHNHAYSSSATTYKARLEMVIGREWVYHESLTATPRHMEFDELYVFDWPLNNDELVAYFPQWVHIWCCCSQCQ